MVVAALCMGLGSIVGARRPATALVAGWGIGGLVLVCLGTLSGSSLSVGLIFLAALGVVGLSSAVRGGFDASAWADLGRTFVLAIPLLCFVASVAPSQFDEFSHWLPNLGYLYLFGHFPTLSQPNLASFRPGYPYGQALVGLAVSRIHGRLDESAGIVWNGLLLIGVGLTIRDVLAARMRESRAADAPVSLQEWGISAAGLLLATTLNPAFVPKLAFTNYGDSAVGSVLAITVGSLILGTLRGRESARGTHWRDLIACGFCCSALVNIRQDSLELFFILLVGVAIWALSERRLGRDVKPFTVALSLAPPALLVAILWRHYVAMQIPGGAFTVLAPGSWRWALLPSALRQMGVIFIEKFGYFALLALVVVMAYRSLARPGRYTTLQRQGLLLGATIGVGQILFMILAYLAADFTEAEVAAANSFWRFTNHVGLTVLVAGITLLPATLWPSRRAAAALSVLAFLSPILALPWIKFDATVHEPYLRAVGNDLATLTKGASSVTLFDYQLGQSTILPIRYQLLVADRASSEAPVPRLNLIMDVPSKAYFMDGGMPRCDPLGAKNDRDISAAMAAPFVWFYDGGDVPSRAIGMVLPRGYSYLVAREGKSIRVVRRWLIPHWQDKTKKYL